MMFVWFRRWRERRALALIRAELAQLAEYEEGHVARQAARIEKQRNKSLALGKAERPHGAYAPDQKRQHVAIRLAGKVKPKLLERLLRVEVPDEE